MRPYIYSVMRMFEFLVVAVIEEIIGDSFNPHFTESMTLRSLPSECMTLRSFPSTVADEERPVKRMKL